MSAEISTQSRFLGALPREGFQRLIPKVGQIRLSGGANHLRAVILPKP
jgi:hypothetical protein